MTDHFSLFLFTHEAETAVTAIGAGIDGVVVDWETRGKHARQAGADTEINAGTSADLSRIRAATDARILCRINPFGSHTKREVETAIRGGADEILLPMVRRPAEVGDLLELVSGRCAVGILIETQDAVERSHELAAFPLSRVYVGLNDLAIDRGTDSIFSAVADGTVAEVRRSFAVPFGFAGLTLPDRGAPVPCRLLIAEMARLGCAFSFLRRSYRRDVPPDEPAQRAAVASIRRSLRTATARQPETVRRDRHDLESVCARLARRPQLHARGAPAATG